MTHTPLAQRINTRKGEHAFTGVIARLERAKSSVNGNPAYWVYFAYGAVVRTQTDSGVAYAIENPEYRGVPVTVALTKAGRIFAIEVAS